MPPKIIESPVVYPNEARRNNWEGNVLVRLFISDKGSVEDAEIIKSSGYEILDAAAVESVKKWNYIPAQKNSKAIFSSAVVLVKFKLKDAISSSVDRDEIKKIQQILNELGFDCGEPDGIMGSKTKQAIINFQQSKGLEPDGIVGPRTKEALGS